MDVFPTCWSPSKTILYLIFPPTVDEDRLINYKIVIITNTGLPLRNKNCLKRISVFVLMLIFKKYDLSRRNQCIYLCICLLYLLYCLLANGFTFLQLFVSFRYEIFLKYDPSALYWKLIYQIWNYLICWLQVHLFLPVHYHWVFRSRSQILEGSCCSVYQFYPLRYQSLVLFLYLLDYCLQHMHSSTQLLKSIFYSQQTNL